MASTLVDNSMHHRLHLKTLMLCPDLNVISICTDPWNRKFKQTTHTLRWP